MTPTLVIFIFLESYIDTSDKNTSRYFSNTIKKTFSIVSASIFFIFRNFNTKGQEV